MKNKTFKSIKRNGKKFNLLALPGTNYFKFEIKNLYGSNVERILKDKLGKNVYGISHLIEHLAFKTSKDYTTEQLIDIKKNEGSCNAGTNYDMLMYWFKTTMDKKDTAISFVANTALNDFKKITQKEFDLEKKIVYNEAKDYADNDHLMFYFNSRSTLLGYDKEDNTIGTPKTIDTFTLEDAITIKNIFLSNNDVEYNVVYDSELSSQEDILLNIEKELERFEVETNDTISISKDEYNSSLAYPQNGSFKVKNEAEQTMTMLSIDAVKDIFITEAVCTYLSNLAESTSLDDLIRQKNGLTYNVAFNLTLTSYKPHITFMCDVSKGSEDKMMELFRESINTSTDNWDKEKHAKYIKTKKLKRTMSNLNQIKYESWFYTNHMQEKALDSFRDILAKDIDSAENTIDKELLTFENMAIAMKSIKESVNNDRFGKVTNL